MVLKEGRVTYELWQTYVKNVYNLIDLITHHDNLKDNAAAYNVSTEGECRGSESRRGLSRYHTRI